MKTGNRILITVLTAALMFGLIGPNVALAATTPSLGMAVTYGVLASTYSNSSAATTITGDVGFTTGPAQAPAGVHTNYGSGAPYATAGIDQATALTNLNSQACTFSFAPGAINLSTDTTHGTAGTYAPGVYCSTGAMDIGGPLTLSGSGAYIFRPVGALTSTTGSIVTLTGASACDVFWTPTAATTLAADTTFFGSIIQPTSSAITVGANVTWTGKALAFGGTVTTGATDTITVPSCTNPTPAATGRTTLYTGTINVVKTVVNDNGGVKTVPDFPLFINDAPVISGVTNTFSFYSSAPYTVTETGDSGYARTFSGDCDVDGVVYLHGGEQKFCIITNNDIGAPVVVPPVPPLIDVVKVASPLSLPLGPGSVTYTYTLRNIGTVPVTNVTMVGDTCSPIVRVSGDVNGDNKLDVNETWVHTCATTLTATHTNTVVATGWANGISATDIASATVVVGLPIVPPLIHVTKIPNPLALRATGGMVTYTNKVTNPGTVSLSNVRLTDDKCSPVKYSSGDSNRDSKLDSSETWVYTCRTHLANTTTNTVIAQGDANGLTARDFAIATVVVAVPKLPNTGIGPDEKNAPWNIVIPTGILAVSLLFSIIRRKQVA